MKTIQKNCAVCQKKGYTKTENQKEADLALFNTCCVRENAEDKLFGKTWRIEKNKRRTWNYNSNWWLHDARKHITDKIKESYPYTDIIFGTHTLHKFPSKIYMKLQKTKQNQKTYQTQMEKYMKAYQ